MECSTKKPDNLEMRELDVVWRLLNEGVNEGTLETSCGQHFPTNLAELLLSFSQGIALVELIFIKHKWNHLTEGVCHAVRHRRGSLSLEVFIFGIFLGL